MRPFVVAAAAFSLAVVPAHAQHTWRPQPVQDATEPSEETVPGICRIP